MAKKNTNKFVVMCPWASGDDRQLVGVYETLDEAKDMSDSDNIILEVVKTTNVFNKQCYEKSDIQDWV